MFHSKTMERIKPISTRNRNRKRISKKPKRRRNLHSSAIKSLSSDLLVDVLARVASSSFTDLFNAKLCCREFLGVAEDDFILEHVRIEKFPVIPWFEREETLCFLNRCKESGNPEALYRQGLVEYFSLMSLESGLDYLKRAAEKGHVEASYVYGIILVCRGGNSKQQGLKILNAVKKIKKSTTSTNTSKSSTSLMRIRECRERTKAIVHTMWIRNYIINAGLQQRICSSCRGGRASSIRIGRTWDEDGGDDEDDDVCCEACRWDGEVISFCNMLRGI